jgi:hypothetical protein
MKLSTHIYNVASWVHLQEQATIRLVCKYRGHVPGECTYYINRGPTFEGVDYYGCKRCKVSL